MFETTWYSVVACLVSYYLLLYVVQDIILKLIPFRGKRAYDFFYAKVDEKTRRHHAQTIVCFIHALISAQGAIRAVFFQNYEWTKESYQNLILIPKQADAFNALLADPLRQFYLEVTLGYFIFDTILFVRHFGEHPIAELWHHLAGIITYIIGLRTGVGSFMMIALQTNEISNPFMHMRFFLNVWDQKEKWYYMADQLIFAGLFLVCRSYFDTWLWYIFMEGFVSKFFEFDNVLAYGIQIAIGTLFVVIQWFWTYKSLYFVFCYVVPINVFSSFEHVLFETIRFQIVQEIFQGSPINYLFSAKHFYKHFL